MTLTAILPDPGGSNPRLCPPRAWTFRTCCQFVYDGLKDELLLIC